jgi:hypothetical protein
LTDEPLPRGTSQNSESSHTSQKPDYATWLTKQQAADAIGVSTKTIEQWAIEGKLQRAVWRLQGRGAQKAVYQPDDVARIAAERRGSPVAFVLPASVTAPVNGNGHQTGISPLTPLTSTAADVASVLCSLVAALQALSPARAETSENSEKSAAAYVDKTAALAIAGVSYGALRAAVQAGEVKQRGRRYRRQDLEQL